ncbi:MBL fold metallo-hydrolase [Gordonia lacunae]|uniref:MBL fold metallo-hydrolase n=1 Tax=Gordonia lacunae TaxID=417102 RepID=UPI0039E3AC04
MSSKSTTSTDQLRQDALGDRAFSGPRPPHRSRRSPRARRRTFRDGRHCEARANWSRPVHHPPSTPEGTDSRTTRSPTRLRHRDVRHVTATHLDIDHIGGFADFPIATLHTTATATEKTLAYSSGLRSTLRYRNEQLPNPNSVVGGVSD